jgi:RimJ/RimL family protein N-acetyltransferase
MDPILTARLRLRPLTLDDLRPLHALLGDHGTMRFISGIGNTPWQTRARLRLDVGLHATFGFGLCLAEWRESGEAIGRAGIVPHCGRHGVEGELAWLFAPSWRGRGLATEAGAALIDFARSGLSLHRLYAEAHPDNIASIRVME